MQIDALLENGITPLVTIYHWDLPLELEKRYGGFVASGEAQERLLEDYEHYASVCFDAFGDRVKHWITHNEVGIYLYAEAVACAEMARLAPGVLHVGRRVPLQGHI